MPEDQFTIEDAKICEGPPPFHPYFVVRKSGDVWRVGQGTTIGAAIEDFIYRKRKRRQKPTAITNDD